MVAKAKKYGDCIREFSAYAFKGVAARLTGESLRVIKDSTSIVPPPGEARKRLYGAN